MSHDTEKALNESFLFEEGHKKIEAQQLLSHEVLPHFTDIISHQIAQGMSELAQRDLISWARSAHEPYAIGSDCGSPAFVNIKESIDQVIRLSKILDSSLGGGIKLKSFQPTSKLSRVVFIVKM